MQDSRPSRKILIIVGVLFVLAIIVLAIVFTTSNSSSETSDGEEAETSETAVEELESESFTSALGYSLTSTVALSVTSAVHGENLVDTLTIGTPVDEQLGLSMGYRSTSNHTPGTPEGYPGIDAAGRAYEVLTLNNLPAVRLSDNPDTLEDYWIYTADRSKVIRATISAASASDLEAYKALLETFRWL